MDEGADKEVAYLNAEIKKLEDLCCITRDIKLQQAATSWLRDLFVQANACKMQRVGCGDEDAANLFLGFEFVLRCLNAELAMWMLLKQDKPDEAWDFLVTSQQCANAALRSHLCLSSPGLFKFWPNSRKANLLDLR